MHNKFLVTTIYTYIHIHYNCQHVLLQLQCKNKVILKLCKSTVASCDIFNLVWFQRHHRLADEDDHCQPCRAGQPHGWSSLREIHPLHWELNQHLPVHVARPLNSGDHLQSSPRSRIPDCWPASIIKLSTLGVLQVTSQHALTKHSTFRRCCSSRRTWDPQWVGLTPLRQFISFVRGWVKKALSSGVINMGLNALVTLTL